MQLVLIQNENKEYNEKHKLPPFIMGVDSRKAMKSDNSQPRSKQIAQMALIT